MARLADQDIPPGWKRIYDMALGQTRRIKYPGKYHPGQIDEACKKYPLRLEPPHVPTMKQLYQRSAFGKSLTYFAHTPDNERHAYYRLSLDVGLFYYNYYHHRNIPRILAGEREPDIMRPEASAYLDEDQIPWGYLAGEFISGMNLQVQVEVETDPLTYEAHYTGVPWALTLTHEYWIYWGVPPFWSIEEKWEIPTGPERSHTLTTQIIQGYFEALRRVVLYRSGTACDQTVVWKLFVTFMDLSYEVENFHTIPV